LGQKLYIPLLAWNLAQQMKRSPYRFALLTAYQFTIVVGIAMLPLAVLTSHFGVTPRVDPALERLGTAYENASDSVGDGPER
jgi:hypothetical protein